MRQHASSWGSIAPTGAAWTSSSSGVGWARASSPPRAVNQRGDHRGDRPARADRVRTTVPDPDDRRRVLVEPTKQAYEVAAGADGSAGRHRPAQMAGLHRRTARAAGRLPAPQPRAPGEPRRMAEEKLGSGSGPAPKALARRRPATRMAPRSTVAQLRGLALERVPHRAGLLVLAPHEHARTGAGDRRAERAEQPRALTSSTDRGYSCARYGWCSRSCEPRGDQVPISARKAEISVAASRTLNTASPSGTLARERRPGRVGGDRLGWDHDQRLQPHRRLEPVHSRALADDKPTFERRRDVVRMSLDLRRERHARRRRARTGDPRRAAPRGSPRRWSRARLTAGSPTRSGTRTRPPGAAARTRARRGSSGRAVRRGPSPPRSFQSPGPRARGAARSPPPARRSPGRGWPRRPGRAPAGAARASLKHRPLDRGQLRIARHDLGRLLERGVRVLQAVAGQHAHDPRCATGPVGE